MPRGRPRTKNLARGRPPSRVTVERKPIRPLERQRMRPWLIDLLNNESCSQLVWSCREENTFRVAWKHAAGQTFDAKADATLFELWARHTGKYYNGDKPDPKRWKANFRCALNSLQDVEEEKSLGVRKGNNAFKIYKFLDEKKPKKSSSKKHKVESDDEEADDEITVLRNMGTKSRPRICSRLVYDSEGSEGINSPASESGHSDWDESPAADPICQDQEMEYDSDKKSPLPDFDQLWQSANVRGYCKRPCNKERLSESHYPERQPEAFSPQRSADISYSPQYPTDNDEEASNTSSCPTVEEIAETIQEYMLNQETDFLNDFLDPESSCYVQEAPEQIIGEDCEYPIPGTGPNVIVLNQEGTFDYIYTSMAEL